MKANFYFDAFSLSTKKSFESVISFTPTTIIAEIKRCSLSKGGLAEIADLVALAKQYVQGGTAAVSVLTDINLLLMVPFAICSGSALNYATGLVAVLRKYFILDSLQIEEAAVAGSDSILLIVAILKDVTKALL